MYDERWGAIKKDNCSIEDSGSTQSSEWNYSTGGDRLKWSITRAGGRSFRTLTCALWRPFQEYGSERWILVPDPGAEAIANVPPLILMRSFMLERPKP